MSNLPDERRIVWGRTFSRSWSHADSDPIERYTHTSKLGAVARWAWLLSLCAFVGWLAAQAF